MHHFGRFDERALAAHPIFEGHSQGYTTVPLVSRNTGSVHTGLSIDQLAPGGTIDPHVHAFEKGVYILRGNPILTINGESYRLRAGDYAAIKVGTPHSWRAGDAPVRWLQMAAPQPKPPGAERDTFFLKDRSIAAEAPALISTIEKATCLVISMPRRFLRPSTPLRALRAIVEGALVSGRTSRPGSKASS